MLGFEWDEEKNRANRRKHGVWFEEAVQIFDDPAAILFYDEKHSAAEDRFILLGMSGSARVLVVAHCEQTGSEVVRIISARKATPREIKRYEEGI